MRAKVLAVAALALSAVGAPAMAASHDPSTFIRDQDRNGDGKVSKDEYAAGREGEYARMDANKDGGLSHDEYVEDFKTRLTKRLEALPADQREERRTREMKQVEVRFGVLDSDKSGTITPAEFAYSGWMMFSTHDTNRDGFVSADDPAKKDGE